MKSSNPLRLVLTVTFSQISLISRSQRDVTWKLPIIPFGDCRMHFYTLFPTKFHKTAGNCTSPTEKSNYTHWNLISVPFNKCYDFQTYLSCNWIRWPQFNDLTWFWTAVTSVSLPKKKNNIIVFNMIICFEEKKLHTYPSL